MTWWQGILIGLVLGVPAGLWLAFFCAFLKGENDLDQARTP